LGVQGHVQGESLKKAEGHFEGFAREKKSTGAGQQKDKEEKALVTIEWV
jgi:hypothetical protein